MVKIYRTNSGIEGFGVPRWVIPVGIVLVLVILVLSRCVVVVPAGHVKVQDLFGKVLPDELPAGLNFPVNPFTTRVEMDIRTKEEKEKIQVPTQEGLIAVLDVSILFHVDPTRADEIYKSVGRNYIEVIVKPVLRNVVRDVIAGYASEDLYSAGRKRISTDIDQRLKETYSQRGITLENVLMRDVNLPREVTSAIEQKIKAKQQAEQMQYVLQKEKSEAERRKIEAQGIADAQQVISQSLTVEYLQWKYISTMQELAGSQNTTFVISPYDQKLVPMLPLAK